MKLSPTIGFIKALKKLKPIRRERVVRALEKFLADPMPASLCFRPLAGAKGYYVIDSSAGDRILLHKMSEEHYEAVDFGTHDMYRKWNRR